MNTDKQNYMNTDCTLGATLRDILAKRGASSEKIDRIEKPLPLLYEEVFAVMKQEPSLASNQFYKYMDRDRVGTLLERGEEDIERCKFVRDLRGFEIATHVLDILARSEHINTNYIFYNIKHRVEKFMRYVAPERGDGNYISSEATAAAAIYCGFVYEKPVDGIHGSINIADQGYQLLKDHEVLLNALVAGI